MAIRFRPSNAQSFEEFKVYVELMLKEYADELNSLRVERLPTVAKEPNPTLEGQVLINEPATFDPTLEGKGVYCFVGGIWKKLDN